MAKSTQRGADERFVLFVLSSGKAVPSALIGGETEILYFFPVFSGLRGTMEVSGAQNSLLFNSPFSIPGGRKSVVGEAKETLKTGGQPRPRGNDLVFQSIDIVGRQVPSLEAAGPLAAFRLGNAVKAITKKTEKTKLPIVDDIERSSRFTNLKVDRLNSLRNSLQTLNTTVDVFLNNGAFNLRVSDSSRQDLIKVKAGQTAPTVNFTVAPTRKAVNSTLASDKQSTPIAALGLNGSFYVNGFKISVETTDSIFELRNKINRGEDINNNGKLDAAEDINNNGTIDIIKLRASEFGPGLYFTEDRNGNRELDPGEDTIDNNRLDGGTLENKVQANVIDNRLILTSLAGGSTRIDLRDDDNILLTLGFFEFNLKGLPIQKEFQFNNNNPAINLNIEPKRALVDVDQTFNDPETIESDFNDFTNIAEDTVVTVQKESDLKSDVQVFIDANNTLNQIKVFFNQFNDSISNINNILSQSKEFAHDREIQNIRNDLTLEPQKKTRFIEKRNEDIDTFRAMSENLKAIGFSISNTEKKIMQELSTSGIVEDVLKGVVSPFSKTSKNLSNRLTSAGIRTISDDTFVLDEPKLKRALEVNAEEVLQIFTDEKSGLLPLLSEKLKSLLRGNLGDLDQKRDQVLVQSKGPHFVTGKHHKFTQISRLDNQVKNLITVV